MSRPTSPARRARRERGSLSPLAAAIIVLLFAATLAFAVPLTQGLSSRRTAATAADAASLAAAQEMSMGFKRTQANMERADDAAFWAFPGSPASAHLSSRMRAEAAELAAANGAELVSMTVNVRRLEVTTTVRMRDDAIPGTGIRAEDTATARVDLLRGLCLSRGRMGYLDGATCLAQPVTVIPAERPVLRPYRADVFLVR